MSDAPAPEWDQDVPIEAGARGKLYYDKATRTIRGTPDPRDQLVRELADALEWALRREHGSLPHIREFPDCSYKACCDYRALLARARAETESPRPPEAGTR